LQQVTSLSKDSRFTYVTSPVAGVSVWFDAFSTSKYQITSAYQERTIDPDNFYSLVIKSGGPIKRDRVFQRCG
jgi:hypothetical protein